MREGEKEVRIYIPENNLASISPGQTAEITFWALPDVTVSGHIREIAPMADPVTRTYQVCVAIGNMPPQVQLGMTAKVHFNDGSESLIILPKAATRRRYGLLRTTALSLCRWKLPVTKTTALLLKAAWQTATLLLPAALPNLRPASRCVWKVMQSEKN